MLEAGVRPVYDTVVKSINGNQTVESVTLENVITGEVSVLETDSVFIFAGMLPQNQLLTELKKDQSGYIITDENMETSVKGIPADCHSCQ